MSGKKLTKLQQEALKLHTHIVVFRANSVEETVAAMAQGGATTKAIAKAVGMSQHEAQYRITKAQREMGVRFRTEYRNGGGLFDEAMSAILRSARARIQKNVTPKFLPLASSRVNQ